MCSFEGFPSLLESAATRCLRAGMALQGVRGAATAHIADGEALQSCHLTWAIDWAPCRCARSASCRTLGPACRCCRVCVHDLFGLTQHPAVAAQDRVGVQEGHGPGRVTVQCVLRGMSAVRAAAANCWRRGWFGDATRFPSRSRRCPAKSAHISRNAFACLHGTQAGAAGTPSSCCQTCWGPPTRRCSGGGCPMCSLTTTSDRKSAAGELHSVFAEALAGAFLSSGQAAGSWGTRSVSTRCSSSATWRWPVCESAACVVPRPSHLLLFV